MANTKVNKRDKFNMVLEMIKGNKMLEDFIKHEIELLDVSYGYKYRVLVNLNKIFKGLTNNS